MCEDAVGHESAALVTALQGRGRWSSSKRAQAQPAAWTGASTRVPRGRWASGSAAHSMQNHEGRVPSQLDGLPETCGTEVPQSTESDIPNCEHDPKENNGYRLFAGKQPALEFGRVQTNKLQAGCDASAVQFAEELFNVNKAVSVLSHSSKASISNVVGQTVAVQLTHKLRHDFERLADGNAVYWPHCMGSRYDRSIFDALYEELSPWKASPYRRSKHPACIEEERLVQSSMYRRVVASLRECFDMEVGYSIVNLYADGNDWTDYHRDAYRADGNRVKSHGEEEDTPLPHNVTVGVSFGEPRELRFRHLQTGMEFSFPQANGDVFAFTEPVNSAFQHCVPQRLPANSVGPRISVILWGRVSEGSLLKRRTS
mmetsp:Transcript_36043/g.81426  ORF Transcript_36043/g.81426 Transcript_36043/m.81426 type:complete len:371 (+) Transcript_36043:65-1177(+)